MSDWRARRAQYLLAKDDMEHPPRPRYRRLKREKRTQPPPPEAVERLWRIPGALSWAEQEMTKRALASVERLLWLRERGKDSPAYFRIQTARTSEPNNEKVIR